MESSRLGGGNLRGGGDAVVGGREKGKVRNAETELTGKNRIIYVQQPKKGRKP